MRRIVVGDLMETFTRCTTLRDGYYSRIIITPPSTRSLMTMNSVMLRKLRSDANPFPTDHDHESKGGMENSKNCSEAWPVEIWLNRADHLTAGVRNSASSSGTPQPADVLKFSKSTRVSTTMAKRASTLPGRLDVLIKTVIDQGYDPRTTSVPLSFMIMIFLSTLPVPHAVSTIGCSSKQTITSRWPRQQGILCIS
jgi:hypothetical protein